MSAFIDIAGMTFGRLTANRRVSGGGDKGAKWECSCQCGRVAVVYSANLRSGGTKSCGCLNRESKPPAFKKGEKVPAGLKTSAGRNNCHARYYEIMSPDRRIYKIVNLSLFVRDNSQLFTEWEMSRSPKAKHPRAVAGLTNLVSSNKTHWHGWKVICHSDYVNDVEPPSAMQSRYRQ